MGGVVELNILQDSTARLPWTSGAPRRELLFRRGLRVKGNTSGAKNALGGSASGSLTDHYLNPVVPEKLLKTTERSAIFSLHYQRDLTSNDRLRLIVRHERKSRYD